MTPETVVEVGQEALMTIIMLAAPVLITGLSIGLFIGMIQAATSIQEMTLSFIPKLLGMFAALIVFGGWMLDLLVNYVTRLYDAIPGLIG
ncbi:flagellar biosynthetic protein FliQ [Ectothiorhodospira haloalkaliphila]|uniref:Flagellar biosynthetic protein FliQ n=1 Tax=Ectothiorhodospira haloalkaliphila TaxID=421628 RepID=W8KP91_9GAMM|nr:MULTISPECIES: flagellar biosynthesis protein FliQ [Ectothiorhodospira]AHK78832.1 flagellar biosynthetic protein FliQ [Ectothiorhodospira haloalkaliphila]MCG5494054.1 flagellar biosynthesis protein FliQ [Ectothiorhodospira variabilis]MCG5498013.1 flagellar biosynthesis protein FliQ [Ectothiorhodospira variabilis]MCG5503416.1 flagellar biosynthesis protein FliQ [Ectothiorhodospira variabilis]MCG5506496.1 flagellar biosynthesis protein FliQ [Ectothiorhodospira variabilis]